MAENNHIINSSKPGTMLLYLEQACAKSLLQFETHLKTYFHVRNFHI